MTVLLGLACPTADHERWKRVEAWWRDQELIGFTLLDDGRALEQRNCFCGSTLGRICNTSEMSMNAPDGYWVSAEGYAKLAREQEAGGFLDLAAYFYGRAHAACVARFDEACAAAEVLEPTEVMASWDGWDEVDARADREAVR